MGSRSRRSRENGSSSSSGGGSSHQHHQHLSTSAAVTAPPVVRWSFNEPDSKAPGLLDGVLARYPLMGGESGRPQVPPAYLRATAPPRRCQPEGKWELARLGRGQWRTGGRWSDSDSCSSVDIVMSHSPSSAIVNFKRGFLLSSFCSRPRSLTSSRGLRPVKEVNEVAS